MRGSRIGSHNYHIIFRVSPQIISSCWRHLYYLLTEGCHLHMHLKPLNYLSRFSSIYILSYCLSSCSLNFQTCIGQVPEFEEAAFSAPLNKVVRCKTKFGWHLLQVLAERYMVLTLKYYVLVIRCAWTETDTFLTKCQGSMRTARHWPRRASHKNARP